MKIIQTWPSQNYYPIHFKYTLNTSNMVIFSIILLEFCGYYVRPLFHHPIYQNYLTSLITRMEATMRNDVGVTSGGGDHRAGSCSGSC